MHAAAHAIAAAMRRMASVLVVILAAIIRMDSSCTETLVNRRFVNSLQTDEHEDQTGGFIQSRHRLAQDRALRAIVIDDFHRHSRDV